MSRYRRRATTGVVHAAESENIWTPRTASDGAAKRGILLCHGAGASHTEFSDAGLVGSLALGDLLGRLGFYVVAADLGGTYTFGNDTVSAASTGRLVEAWNVLKTLGCLTDKAIGVGVSMGGLTLLNAARANAVPLSGIAGIIPVCDLADFLDNNRAGLANNVCDAWGIAHGSTSSSLPSRANPNTSTNAALIHTAGPDVYLSYSTADTVNPPATITSLAGKLTTAGCAVTTVVHSTADDHTENSVLLAAQRDELITFLGAHA